jgi:hypothetical protein
MEKKKYHKELKKESSITLESHSIPSQTVYHYFFNSYIKELIKGYVKAIRLDDHYSEFKIEKETEQYYWQVWDRLTTWFGQKFLSSSRNKFTLKKLYDQKLLDTQVKRILITLNKEFRDMILHEEDIRSYAELIVKFADEVGLKRDSHNNNRSIKERHILRKLNEVCIISPSLGYIRNVLNEYNYFGKSRKKLIK